MGRIRYFSTVLAEVGGMLVTISPLTAVPLAVAVLFREFSLISPMAAIPVILFLLGVLLNRLPRRKEDIRLSSAFCSVALVWLVFALVSTIPFILVLRMSFTDALFETMAGWTGTGFTLLWSGPAVPETILFWRTFMQWIGGLGVIALSITIASRGGIIQSPFFHADSRSERILPGVITTGKEIWAVYLFLTIIGAGVILVSGIPLYEAVVLSITTISTGGFLPNPLGFAAYTTPLLMYLLIPIMIVGSTPFTLYYISYRRRKLSIFGNRQVLLLFIFLIGGAALVALDLSSLGGMAITDAVGQGLFITTAAISTTGFPIAGLSHLPAVTLILLTLLMFIGGSSESTAGGIKLARIIIGYRGIVWWFKRMFARSKVLVPFTYAGENVPASVAEQEISKNMLVIILSFLTVCLATIVALQFNMFYPDVTALIFDIVSAMSSCGLSAGYISAGMPLASKWVFILVMWIGRLEVIPVIVLFMGIFRGSP